MGPLGSLTKTPDRECNALLISLTAKHGNTILNSSRSANAFFTSCFPKLESDFLHKSNNKNYDMDTTCVIAPVLNSRQLEAE